MDYDIDCLVSNLDFHSNKLNTVGNNLMLTNKEIEILDRYKINYLKCNSLKEILFEVEEILNDMDIVDEELDQISQSISERDYYQNTNK
jgi:hypothetical protein